MSGGDIAGGCAAVGYAVDTQCISGEAQCECAAGHHGKKESRPILSDVYSTRAFSTRADREKGSRTLEHCCSPPRRKARSMLDNCTNASHQPRMVALRWSTACCIAHAERALLSGAVAVAAAAPQGRTVAQPSRRRCGTRPASSPSTSGEPRGGAG